MIKKKSIIHLVNPASFVRKSLNSLDEVSPDQILLHQKTNYSCLLFTEDSPQKFIIKFNLKNKTL